MVLCQSMKLRFKPFKVCRPAIICCTYYENRAHEERNEVKLGHHLKCALIHRESGYVQLFIYVVQNSLVLNLHPAAHSMPPDVYFIPLAHTR